MEILYPYETECQIVNDNGVLRIDWDYAQEPGGGLTGGEFGYFAPRAAPRQYFFCSNLDIQPPPGFVVRIEPHPRFFTDDTGTIPCPMIAHLQSEWYPKELFLVFRASSPGQRQIFRKGEPYAQILVVPQHTHYELSSMTAEEVTRRRKLEREIQQARASLATHRWQNCDGSEMDNHYKILAAAYADEGVAGVEAAVRAAVQRHLQALPHDKPIAECLAQGGQLVNQQKYREAKELYTHILERQPQNAEALSQLGICLVCIGHIDLGVKLMAQAVALQPQIPRLHSSLGEILRLLGRFQEAEAAFRWSLQLQPNDPGIWSVLGLTLGQQGRHTEGIQACRAALAMGHAPPAAHCRLGWILAQQKQFGEARACYQTALNLDSQCKEASRALQELPPAE